MSVPIQPVLPGLPGQLLVIALAIAALVLLFAGRSIIKVVAFFVVGLIGVALGGTIGVVTLGPLGALIGAVLGFIVGGFLGMALLALGISLIIGYAGYVLALDLSGNPFVALVIGFVLFVIGLAFHNKIISVVTAVAGGILLFDVLRMLGMEVLVSTIIALLAVVAGIYVQSTTGKRIKSAGSTQSAATNPANQQR